jgi:DNA polymerase I-like protein with 3'-5' exonuclease and polymerase domains
MGVPGNDNKGWRPNVVHHDDGVDRIHSTYMAMLMDTLRNGCHNPNYQQIPSSSKRAELFKQVLTVPDIHKQYLVSLDFSGMQLRLATIDSKDRVLLKAYRDNPNTDVHSKTGYNIFCSNVEFNIDEVHIDIDGKHRVYLSTDMVKIIRDGKSIKVQAKELITTDVMVAS